MRLVKLQFNVQQTFNPDAGLDLGSGLPVLMPSHTYHDSFLKLTQGPTDLEVFCRTVFSKISETFL